MKMYFMFVRIKSARNWLRSLKVNFRPLRRLSLYTWRVEWSCLLGDSDQWGDNVHKNTSHSPYLTPYRAKVICLRNIKIYFHFILRKWYGADSCNISSWMSRTRSRYVVNSMVPDVLATKYLNSWTPSIRGSIRCAVLFRHISGLVDHIHFTNSLVFYLSLYMLFSTIC